MNERKGKVVAIRKESGTARGETVEPIVFPSNMLYKTRFI